MFEFLLFSSLIESPNLGRFNTIQECNYVRNIYIKDHIGDSTIQNSVHCIKLTPLNRQKHENNPKGFTSANSLSIQM